MYIHCLIVKFKETLLVCDSQYVRRRTILNYEPLKDVEACLSSLTLTLTPKGVRLLTLTLNIFLKCLYDITYPSPPTSCDSTHNLSKIIRDIGSNHQGSHPNVVCERSGYFCLQILKQSKSQFRVTKDRNMPLSSNRNLMTSGSAKYQGKHKQRDVQLYRQVLVRSQCRAPSMKQAS